MLAEILRSGARALLTQSVEAEVAEFLAKHADLKTETGQQRVGRHGHLPERAIMTGIGPVAVRQPRVRDREATEGERIRYSPSIVPRSPWRKSLEVLIPVLLSEGHPAGDFEEALAALVGKSLPLRRQGTRAVYRPRPSPASRACPRESGGGVDRGAYALAEARSVSKALRLLLGRRHRLQARLEEQAQCILVIIGATPEGRKELVGFTDGIRESYNRGVICCSI